MTFPTCSIDARCLDLDPINTIGGDATQNVGSGIRDQTKGQGLISPLYNDHTAPRSLGDHIEPSRGFPNLVVLQMYCNCNYIRYMASSLARYLQSALQCQLLAQTLSAYIQ